MDTKTETKTETTEKTDKVNHILEAVKTATAIVAKADKTAPTPEAVKTCVSLAVNTAIRRNEIHYYPALANDEKMLARVNAMIAKGYTVSNVKFEYKGAIYTLESFDLASVVEVCKVASALNAAKKTFVAKLAVMVDGGTTASSPAEVEVEFDC